MILVLLVINIIIMFLGAIVICRDEDNGGVILAIGILGFIITGLVAIFLLIMVVGGKIDNEKIQMYTEENTKIETKVKETVRAYMDYEEKTYTNLVKSADLETLLIKYPELNSNVLVQEEINTYKENSAKIKQLEESQINRKIYKWWLYFGK